MDMIGEVMVRVGRLGQDVARLSLYIRMPVPGVTGPPASGP